MIICTATYRSAIQMTQGMKCAAHRRRLQAAAARRLTAGRTWSRAQTSARAPPSRPAGLPAATRGCPPRPRRPTLTLPKPGHRPSAAPPYPTQTPHRQIEPGRPQSCQHHLKYNADPRPRDTTVRTEVMQCQRAAGASRTGGRRERGGRARRRRADEHIAELQAGQAALQRVRRVVDQVRVRVARRARQQHVLRACTHPVKPKPYKV